MQLHEKIIKLLIIMLSLGTTFFALSHCGGVGLTAGSIVSPSDARPSGTPQFQGAFNGSNGKTVTGTALVFSSGGGAYVVRLEGLSAPTDSGLRVRYYINGVPQNTALRASSGNQNYSTTGATNANFSQVDIYYPVNDLIYGTATLSPP